MSLRVLVPWHEKVYLEEAASRRRLHVFEIIWQLLWKQTKWRSQDVRPPNVKNSIIKYALFEYRLTLGGFFFFLSDFWKLWAQLNNKVATQPPCGQTSFKIFMNIQFYKNEQQRKLDRRYLRYGQFKNAHVESWDKSIPRQVNKRFWRCAHVSINCDLHNLLASKLIRFAGRTTIGWAPAVSLKTKLES